MSGAMPDPASEVVRAALTETRSAFGDMPARVAELGALAGRLDEVRSANVDHAVELLRDARAAGARVACLGELFTAPYFALHRHPLWLDLAEDARAGPTVTTLSDVARELGLIVVAPLYELDPRSGKRFNTAVVLDERGTWLGRYRKTHVPAGANERAEFHEDFYYERSDGDLGNGPADVSRNRYFPVFETSAGRLGIATCYDRHFEGSVRTLASNGAQLVFSPAVTFGAKSRRMWDLEFAVDAMRHRVFVGGSNRRGSEPPFDVEYFGASWFCGPDGRVPPLPSRAELVVADLDLGALARDDPAGWNLARDARPEAYDD